MDLLKIFNLERINGALVSSKYQKTILRTGFLEKKNVCISPKMIEIYLRRNKTQCSGMGHMSEKIRSRAWREE